VLMTNKKAAEPNIPLGIEFAAPAASMIARIFYFYKLQKGPAHHRAFWFINLSQPISGGGLKWLWRSLDWLRRVAYH
jgi:hypothetical protein